MFSLQFSKIFASRLVRPLAMLVIAALAAPGIALADSQWKSVGSTGIVDESCYFAIQRNGFVASMVPGLFFPCTIRYQVTDTFGGAILPNNLSLGAHIRGASATTGQVVVRLREYPKAGPMTSGRIVEQLDSTTAASALLPNAFTAYRSPSGAGCGTLNLNFTDNSYWIEVELIPRPFPALPGLTVAMVHLETCV